MKVRTLIDFLSEAALEYHDTLNPAFWKDGELDPAVREHLLRIADSFIDYLNIPRSAVKDVVFCGGNANFNYTSLSDVDVHLIVNEAEITNCANFLKDYFLAKKKLWSIEHDVRIKGYPVELYAQPTTERFVNSQGVFSLTQNRWIQEPRREPVNLQDPNLQAKITELKRQIDELADVPGNIDGIKRLKEKIKRMRREALKRGGEFAIGNLVFKALRNDGYLNKLSSVERRAEDDQLSLA